MPVYLQVYSARCYFRVKIDQQYGLRTNNGITIDDLWIDLIKYFMKKLWIVLLLAVGITSAEAQSMLRVHLTDNTPVNVAVDGRYFNKRGTGVTVGDLPPGRHLLQIYQATQDRRGRTFQDVIYEGKVKTYNGMISLFTYDPASNGIDIQQQDINTYSNNLPPEAQGQNQNQRQYNNNGYNGNQDNYAGNNDNNDAAPDISPVSADKIGTLTDTKIDALKNKVAAKNTDTEKMKLLKDGLKDEKMTTNQVGVMIDWFGFESSKVDFAKWAYDNTVDNEYFSDLDAKFTYKNYQEDLDKFIQSKK